MNEQAFNDSIDQKFPYQDFEQGFQLIREAKSISENASFMVLHEICRPPESAQVDAKIQTEWLEKWKGVNQDKLSATVAMFAMGLIKKEPISEENGLDLMEILRNFHGQYNALAIVYFACFSGGHEVEDLFEAILNEWDPTRN